MTLNLIFNYLSNRKKVYAIIGFLVIISSPSSAQNAILGDSLELVYTQSKYPPKDKLSILKQLAFNHSDIEKKLEYSNKLITNASALDSIKYLYFGYHLKGNVLTLKSDYSNALENYFQAAKFAQQEKMNHGEVFLAIADVYSNIGNSNNAATYYNQAINELRIENDSIQIASALLNAGDEYFNIGNLDTAYIYTQEAGTIFDKVNYPLGKAYSLGNIGMIFAEQGKDRKAEINMNEAIRIMENLSQFYPIAVYLTYISDIYQTKGNTKQALNYAHKSLELAQTHGLKQQISDANLKLSELYEKAKNPNQSFTYYKAHIAYRDSVNNIDAVQKMADLRTDFEVSQKQVEVDLLKEEEKNQRLIRIGLTAILGLISALLFSVYRNSREIAKEKKRSDNLLLNILPADTAEELKTNGKVKARRFDNVSVLFTDFVGFTSFSRELSPEVLVECIDYYFTQFDKIIEKHGLEKIKTIGDSYMCASGLPFPSANHAHQITLAALELIAFFKKERIDNPAKEIPFEVRIGINSGPVVAGVVGFKKFAYDIWGDTVNTASRLETNSALGRINISEATYLLIKEDFDCEYRGTFEVKNKGSMKMYFVNGVNQNRD